MNGKPEHESPSFVRFVTPCLNGTAVHDKLAKKNFHFTCVQDAVRCRDILNELNQEVNYYKDLVDKSVGAYIGD